MIRFRVRCIALCAIALAMPADAADLYTPGNWSSLATDRRAFAQGDIVTILVLESSSASNSATSGLTRETGIAGDVGAGSAFNESVSLGLRSRSDNRGSTGRSGRMVAQIGANIDEVLGNGDLRVSGQQKLNINGESTIIRVQGRVRPADMSASNTIVSSRLADAEIDYDGTGFVSRSARPGIITRIFNWLGIL